MRTKSNLNREGCKKENGFTKVATAGRGTGWGVGHSRTESALIRGSERIARAANRRERTT